MPSIFTRIIDGEIPGRFVWRDDRAVAFLSIEPMRPGHVLVVPRTEVDHWIDLEPELAAHLFTVAQQIGRAQQAEWNPRRVGVLIVGDEVPHVHIHVVPITSPAGAIRQVPLCSVPSSPAKHAAESNRGRQSQSIDPSLPTSAAVCRSPMMP